ncbi:HAMP domain-containing sensor histidine kinase [Lachnoanaerobaculum sp. JCM 36186]|uniref:sensor histidine kinase n=1 Tax=Lachnoanaerobaculum sanguinis TaxID=3065809 RepID=UPI0027611007|nr:HAMP domain-containing sensor histidine kinase [Lachnoanaerobaculum sp. JCM 36186]GMO01760.1 HAMP domain-containing sensor histidine kinase [Lachnoanaerobaculum sp. JCM 36186]
MIQKFSHSLRMKITLIILLIISVLLLSIGLLNNFGLRWFYQNEKVSEIKEAYLKIDNEVMKIGSSGQHIIDESTEESVINNSLKSIILDYSNKYNITIALVDSFTNKAIYSSAREGDGLISRIQDGFIGNQNQDILYSNNNYTIILHKTMQNTSFIEGFGYCSDNQTMVIMSTPVASLKESVSISNRFLIYMAIIGFIITVILTFIIAKMITYPILELAEISNKMGKLDFTAKYIGNRSDEIQTLGQNMNYMSDRLKKAIDELQEANELLKEDIKRKEAIDEMRKDFIANVSHELKTPIALIQGYAEGLNEGLCEDEESRKYYTEVILDESEKMNKMVKQLLTLSSLESGNSILHKENFNLTSLIESVLGSISILIGEKNVNIEFDSDKEIFLNADEFKIEEVVTNYISNSIHHVSDSGEIKINVSDDGENITFSVYNTGNPIPEKDLNNIWEKFFKVDKAHSRAYGGSGIGLSIVKAIVEAHNGTVAVRNILDGVEFSFKIPKA